VVYLEAVLTTLNVVTFGLSLWFTVFGMKAVIYVLYMFRITLVYLLVRPHLAAAGSSSSFLAIKAKRVATAG
jgi:hypothetical protein